MSQGYEWVELGRTYALKKSWVLNDISLKRLKFMLWVFSFLSRNRIKHIFFILRIDTECFILTWRIQTFKICTSLSQIFWNEI